MSNSELMNSGTIGGAILYLNTMVEKGKGTPGAINPLKIALEKVVSEVDGESWQQTKVSTINVDDYIARFATLTSGKYTESSIAAYKSRVNRVFEWYKKFIESPGFFPQLSTRKISSKAAKQSVERTPTSKSHDVSRIAEAELVPDFFNTNPNLLSGATVYREDILTIPFPLSDGVVASFSLPKKISASDASRISDFIKALVYEEDK